MTGSAGEVSFVMRRQPKSFDWLAKGAKRHALGRLGDALFAEACGVLNQIIALG